VEFIGRAVDTNQACLHNDDFRDAERNG